MATLQFAQLALVRGCVDERVAVGLFVCSGSGAVCTSSAASWGPAARGGPGLYFRHVGMCVRLCESHWGAGLRGVECVVVVVVVVRGKQMELMRRQGGSRPQ